MLEVEASDQDNEGQEAFVVPSMSLPKGGGAIRGMGEKFVSNPATGTGSMTLPLPLSPGRSGFTPQLALTHHAGSGNGPFSALVKREYFPYFTKGWDVTILSVQLCAVREGELRTAMAQGLDLAACTEALNGDGSFGLSLLPDGDVLTSDRQANVFAVVTYALEST
jgi:hypothetical protein